MGKFERMRKRREEKRSDAEILRPKAEVTVELSEPEIKPTERTSLDDPQKIKKSELKPDSKPNLILAQIPRYAYLLAIFALLAGVFFSANNTWGTLRLCYPRHSYIVSWTSWRHTIIQSHNVG